MTKPKLNEMPDPKAELDQVTTDIVHLREAIATSMALCVEHVFTIGECLQNAAENLDKSWDNSPAMSPKQIQAYKRIANHRKQCRELVAGLAPELIVEALSRRIHNEPKVVT